MTQVEFEDFMDEWLIRQFTYGRAIDVIEVREAMLDRYEDDPEFWQDQSMWKLYDGCGKTV